MTSEAQPGQEQRMVTDERVKPHVPHWNGYGKYSPCISLDTGSLTIYGGGFDAKDGDGYFCFNDDDLEFEQDDGPVYRSINVANSDLLHLRDQLNKLFPTRPTADLGDDGELVERAIALREECRKGVEDRGVMPDYVDACVALKALAPKLLDRLILYREAVVEARNAIDAARQVILGTWADEALAKIDVALGPNPVSASS